MPRQQGEDDTDSGSGDVSLSAIALSSSSSSNSRSHHIAFFGNGPLNSPARLDRSYDDHPFAKFPPPVAAAGALPASEASDSRSGQYSDSKRRSKAFTESKDSLISAASGAYFSAEEDIADRPVSSEATPRSSSHAPRETRDSNRAATPNAKSSKLAEKSRQWDDPPLSSPLFSPRKESLSRPTRLAALDMSSASRPSSSTAGSSSSDSGGLQGGDLSAVLPAPSSLTLTTASHPASLAQSNLEPDPTGCSKGLRSLKSPVSSISRKQNPSDCPSPVAQTAGLGMSMPVERDLGAFKCHRLSVLSTDQQHGVEVKLLQRWILSTGCVNFDLEKGPDLESLSPPLDISREEKDNIAFSAFPDTSIFDVGDTVFSFRVREVPLDASISSPPNFNSALGARRGSKQRSGQFDLEPRTQAHGKEKSEQLAASTSTPSEGSQMFSEASNSSSTDLHDGRDLKRSFSAGDVNPMLRPRASFMKATGSQASPNSAGKVSNSSSSSYINGYVFFRQKRDPTIRRGYFQKSLVILSHLPYVALFSEIASRLGPLYFEHGGSILEAFSSSVTKWPNPAPGATLPLPFLGSVLWAALPLGRQGQSSSACDGIESSPTKSQSTLSLATLSKGSMGRIAGPRTVQPTPVVAVPGSSVEEPILASIPLTPLVSVFKEALADMWLIWECVLLAEPILVIGPDPRTCSEAVWHLLDICRPIPHAGDFRPFFTIHDYDFKNLATRKQPPAGTIIGCTNPFLAQACSHWPHVLRVGKAASKLGTAGKYGKAGQSKIPLGGGVAGGTGAGGGGPEHLPGFVTKRKRRVSKDRPLLKKLQDMVEKEENVLMVNALLRRYFADITERFLAPLNRYVSSLIPHDAPQGGGPVDASQIKAFNTDAFLASLKAHGTPLPLRSRSLPTGAAVRQSLYLDFLRSPNFSYYLTERIAYYCTRNPIPSSSKTRFEH